MRSQEAVDSRKALGKVRADKERQIAVLMKQVEELRRLESDDPPEEPAVVDLEGCEAYELPSDFDVLWVDSIVGLNAMTAELQTQDIVAVDCEWRDQKGDDILSVIQISSPDRCYLVDAQSSLGPEYRASLSVALEFVFSRGLVLVWGFAEDSRRLRLLHKPLEPLLVRVRDVQRTAKSCLARTRTPSLKLACADFLGRTLDKGEQVSDWTARPLSQGQIRYAAADVRILLDLAWMILGIGCRPDYLDVESDTLPPARSYRWHFLPLIAQERAHAFNTFTQKLANTATEELVQAGAARLGLRGAIRDDRVVRMSVADAGEDEDGLKSQSLRTFPVGPVAITAGVMGPLYCEEWVFIGNVIDVYYRKRPRFLDIEIESCRRSLIDSRAWGGRTAGGETGSIDDLINSFVYAGDPASDDEMDEAMQSFSDNTTLWRMDTWFSEVSFDRMTWALMNITNHSGEGAQSSSIHTKILDSFPWTKQDVIDRSEDFSYRIDVGDPSGVGPSSSKVCTLEDFRKLNPSQRKALLSSLDVDFSLIQGPPGTGKTRVACLLLDTIVQDMRAGRSPRHGILATAFTNRAADVLLEGLHKRNVSVVRWGRTLNENLIDLGAMKRATKSLAVQQASKDLDEALARKRQVHNQVSAGLKKNILISKSMQSVSDARRMKAKVIKEAIQHELKTAEVVVATCIGSGSRIFDKLSFETVLLDEASQAMEPATLVPLTHGCRRCILVGDQNQLPPTVMNQAVAKQGLCVSLFERLVMAGVKPVLLDEQYRMHPFIADFISKQFYFGRVKNGCKEEDRMPPQGFPGDGAPLKFIPVAGSAEKRGGDGVSWVNYKEATAVVDKVISMLKDSAGKIWPEDIVILSPYAAQVRVIARELEQRGLAQDALVEVATVDSFQGRECEIVLLSTVRANLNKRVGFLSDWRRLNVAVSRARRGLLVFGHAETLQCDENWNALVKYQNSYVSESRKKLQEKIKQWEKERKRGS